MIVVPRKVGNQVRSSSKNCRKLSNFGFINCLVGSFLFVFWETRESKYLLNWVKWCPPKGHNSCLPCQATKLKLNCTEIERTSETVMKLTRNLFCFSFNYCTHQFTFELFLISVLVGLKYRTKRKRKMKNVWFWFLFDLFCFLAPRFKFDLLIFVDLCCENEQLQKRPSNVVLEWNPSIG